MTKKIIVFDMDGTIADFYGVSGWLEDLHNESVRPYVEAKPLYSMVTLNALLNIMRNMGWHIVVTSWLSQGSTKKYDEEVRNAKKGWLARYEFPYDEIHLVKHGTTKANCTRHHGGYQILVDDNSKVRKGWSLGDTINPVEDDLIEILKNLIKKA